MIVRHADAGDREAIVRIYNWYIDNSHATFDVAPITVDDRAAWFAQFAPIGPHRLLVAIDGGEVIGYAGSVAHREHVAFAGTVELTIYLDHEHTRRGTGSALYGRLLAELANEPIHLIVAGIALPNEASIALHRRFGFRPVGIFDRYAQKNGVEISSLWMQRRLHDQPSDGDGALTLEGAGWDGDLDVIRGSRPAPPR
ncbi:MAG: GNAT family N-acetyltransferase [Ilumatobacteraceae bacterium]